jgi:hypothetical protein
MSAIDALNPARPISIAPAPKVGKPTLVLCAKAMTPADQAVFAEFGNVVVWSDKYLNVPLTQITPFDYLIVDMNSKNARLTLGRTDLTAYNVVNYVSTLQKIEDFIEQVGGTTITSVPKEAVNKQDFDLMLTTEKLVSPSMIKSGLKWLWSCLKK